MGLIILGLPLLVIVALVAMVVWPTTNQERQAHSDAVARGDYQTAYFARKEADRKVGVVVGVACALAVIGAVLFLVVRG